MLMKVCCVVLVAVSPIITQAVTLDAYFKVLELIAKKRDIWRKIFLGNDIGFDVSPWLFNDRVKPPYVPIVTTFPRFPLHGHYHNERPPLPHILPPQPLPEGGQG
nr:uncharacterized protein LOC128693836 [Cherax quadricarinatus]